MKKLLAISVATILAASAVTGAILINSESSMMKIKGTDDDHILVFDENHNVIPDDSGSYIAYSNTDGDFLFHYELVEPAIGGWGEFTDEYSILYNDVTRPLTGLLSITIDATDDVLVSYSKTYCDYFAGYSGEVISDTTTFNFKNTYPAYIRIELLNDNPCIINSITMVFDCVSNSGNSSVVISSGVTYEVFNGDSSLVACSITDGSDVTISRNDLANIDYGSFNGCSIGELTITAESGIAISANAFMGLTVNKVILPVSIGQIATFAFSGYPIADLYYSGTKDQWDDIIKEPSWQGDGGYLRYIHCSDETIDLQA